MSAQFRTIEILQWDIHPAHNWISDDACLGEVAGEDMFGSEFRSGILAGGSLFHLVGWQGGAYADP